MTGYTTFYSKPNVGVLYLNEAFKIVISLRRESHGMVWYGIFPKIKFTLYDPHGKGNCIGL